MPLPFPHQVHPLYTSALFARRTEGVIVPPAQVSIGDWEPQLHQCHDNVTTWCNHNQDFQIVRGWLHIDFLRQLPYEIFLAHSVIRDRDGALWDITPLQATQPYPFLVANEPENDYAIFIEQGAYRLAHYK